MGCLFSVKAVGCNDLKKCNRGAAAGVFLSCEKMSRGACLTKMSRLLSKRRRLGESVGRADNQETDRARVRGLERCLVWTGTKHGVPSRTQTELVKLT